jgi:aryl-alcohol dehydrogenase-like predicted oxidoreductase
MGPGPNEKGLTRAHILHQVNESLRRLKTDYIDLYQMHSFDPLTPIEETVRAFDDLVRSGKVRYVGASNVSAWQLMKALSFAKHNRYESFASLQAYYTIAGRDLERELVPLLKDQQVGLLVWSPLAGGFLSGKYKRNATGDEGRRTESFDFPPVNKGRAFDILDALEPLASQKNATVAQLALAWLLHQSAVTSVIIGANKVEQLDDNLKAIDVKFTPDELRRLDELSKLPAEYPGWMLERTGGDRSK